MNRSHARDRAVILIGAAVTSLIVSGCARPLRRRGAPADLLAPDKLDRWRLTPAYSDAKPWTLGKGIYRGHGSWVGHGQVFEDFVLECEFFFEDQQGGIVVRGDRDSLKPWESGYELDIDWAKGHTQGHIHFPVLPKPYAGEVLFEPGRWHRLRVEAVGPRITVFLDGEKALAFTDRQFTLGHICLEGEEGGVKYRRLRARRLGQ